MEIQLVSFYISRFTSKERQFRIDSISRILNETEADFVLFSEHVLKKQEDLFTVASNVRNKHVTALFELEETKYLNGNRLYLFKNGSITALNTNQIFATSQQATEDNIECLIEELENRRKFEVAGKRFLVFQCGENNILKGNTGTAEFRLANRQDLKRNFNRILKDADVILNPVHSKWSRYGCFLTRMRKFSLNKRYCFSCTRIIDQRQLELARINPKKNVTQLAMHNKSLVSPIYTNDSDSFLLQSYKI